MGGRLGILRTVHFRSVDLKAVFLKLHSAEMPSFSRVALSRVDPPGCAVGSFLFRADGSGGTCSQIQGWLHTLDFLLQKKAKLENFFSNVEFHF